MAQTAEATIEETKEKVTPEMDSKYRMIIVAAKRSKQIQRGATPRVDIDPLKHKATRIAIQEVLSGKIHFTIDEIKPK
jgi:DNA-directed RNA polymerase subunit omega